MKNFTALIAQNTHLMALALSCTLAACGDKATEPASTQAPQAGQAAPVVAQAAPEEANLGRKLDVYIDCYNGIDESIHRSANRYSSWVKDMNAGPTGKEQVVYGLYEVADSKVSQCVAQFESIAKRGPSLPALEAAAQQYIAAAQSTAKSVSAIYPYYSRENYKDDAFAQGKKAHADLAAQFAAFTKVSNQFSAALDAENDKAMTAQLAEVEKTEGRKMTYWQMATMQQAKSLMGVVGESTFDAAEAARKLAAYEATADGAIAYAKANKSEVANSWVFMENASEEFRKAAKERLRRIRDKVPYNEGEKMMLTPGSAWMVDGSEEKVVRTYNALVDASNRMN